MPPGLFRAGRFSSQVLLRPSISSAGGLIVQTSPAWLHQLLLSASAFWNYRFRGCCFCGGRVSVARGFLWREALGKHFCRELLKEISRKAGLTGVASCFP